MNSHSYEIACAPSKSAGPTLRAGFTEVPVIGMQIIYMDHHQCETDGHSRKLVLSVFGGNPKHDKHEDEREHGFGHESGRHSPLRKTVGTGERGG